MFGNFNTFLSTINITRQKINKDIEELNNTTVQQMTNSVDLERAYTAHSKERTGP